MKYNIMLVFGILIIAVGTLIVHQSNRSKNSQRIQKLEDSLNLKNIELTKKSDSIKDLTTEVLDFSKTIDNNTTEIGKLSIKIKDLSKNTNQISKAIKKEQKLKGRLKLSVPDSEKYRIIIGASSATFLSKEILEFGVGLIRYREDYSTLSVKLVNNELLISSKVYDSNLNLVVDIIDNNWAISGDLFSKNFNKNSIEIIDKKGIVVFQLSIYEEAIIVKGILFDPNKINVFTDEISTTLLNDDPDLHTKTQGFSSKITRIFNHEGEHYLGDRMPVSQYIKQLIESDRRNARNSKEYFKLSNTKIIETAKNWGISANKFKERWIKENPHKSTEKFQDMLVENNKKHINNIIYNYAEDMVYISHNESDSELRSNYLEGALIIKVLKERDSNSYGTKHIHSLHYPENYSYRLFCELIQDMEKSITELEKLISNKRKKKIFEKNKILYGKLEDIEIKNKILITIEKYKEFLERHEQLDKKISSYLYNGENEEYFEKSSSFYKKMRKEYSDKYQDEIILLMLQLLSRNPDLKKSVREYDGHMLEHPHNMLGFKEVLTIINKLSKDFL